MFRYCFAILFLNIFILNASTQVNSGRNEDYKCDDDWMSPKFHIDYTGRSHFDHFKKCIEDEDYDVDDQSPANGTTALHTATAQGDIKAMNYLIGKGAKLEIHEYDLGFTPLHEAVINGEIQAVRLLIDKGANVNARIYSEENPIFSGESALHLSVRNLDIIATRILLERGVKVNSLDQEQNTPLQILLHYSYLGITMNHRYRQNLISEICATLVNAGANVQNRNTDGLSAADMAVQILEVDSHSKADCAKTVLRE